MWKIPGNGFISFGTPSFTGCVRGICLRINLLIFSIFFFFQTSSAQKNSVRIELLSTNTVHVELGGGALIYSINYDKIWNTKSQKGIKLNANVGMSYYNGRNEIWHNKYGSFDTTKTKLLYIPLRALLFFGKGPLFFGAGIVAPAGIAFYYFNENHDGWGPSFNYPTLIAEVRIQNKNGGAFYAINLNFTNNLDLIYFSKIFFNPFNFSYNESKSFILPWPGVSIGYTFPGKKVSSEVN